MTDPLHVHLTKVREHRREFEKMLDAELATEFDKSYGPGSRKYPKARREAVMDEVSKRLRWGTKRERQN